MKEEFDVRGPNGLDFDVAKGFWHWPTVQEKRGKSVFLDCLTGRLDGISDVRIYQDGEECAGGAAGLAMDKEEFLKRAKGEIIKGEELKRHSCRTAGEEKVTGYETVLPWAILDFEFNSTDELMEEISKRYDLEGSLPAPEKSKKLERFLGGYDIESMDSEQLFKLAEKLMEEGVIPARPDENGLNQIAVFPKALYDAFLSGDASQLGGVVRDASGFMYMTDSAGGAAFGIPEFGLGRLKYEQQMLEDAFRRFEQYYTEDELNRHIQLANSKAKFMEFLEMYFRGKEEQAAQNGIRTEGTGDNMVKTMMLNGQRVYVIDGEVMEAHGYKVTITPSYFDEAAQTWKEGQKKDALSEEELYALKQRYDSDNMTEKECISLLGELVEAGILTKDEAAGIYDGNVPLDITQQNGVLQKCTPEMEAARARWNKASGGVNGSGNLNRKMGYEYFESWYGWAKMNTNADNPEQEKSFADMRKFMKILKELGA